MRDGRRLPDHPGPCFPPEAPVAATAAPAPATGGVANATFSWALNTTMAHTHTGQPTGEARRFGTEVSVVWCVRRQLGTAAAVRTAAIGVDGCEPRLSAVPRVKGCERTRGSRTRSSNRCGEPHTNGRHSAVCGASTYLWTLRREVMSPSIFTAEYQDTNRPASGCVADERGPRQIRTTRHDPELSSNHKVPVKFFSHCVCDCHSASRPFACVCVCASIVYVFVAFAVCVGVCGDLMLRSVAPFTSLHNATVSAPQ